MNEVRVNDCGTGAFACQPIPLQLLSTAGDAAGRVASGHPWIFASDLANRDGPQAGEAARVADLRGRSFGAAHYSRQAMR